MATESVALLGVDAETRLACQLLREHAKKNPGVGKQWDQAYSRHLFCDFYAMDKQAYGGAIKGVIGEKCPTLAAMDDAKLGYLMMQRRRDISVVF